MTDPLPWNTQFFQMLLIDCHLVADWLIVCCRSCRSSTNASWTERARVFRSWICARSSRLRSAKQLDSTNAEWSHWFAFTTNVFQLITVLPHTHHNHDHSNCYHTIMTLYPTSDHHLKCLYRAKEILVLQFRVPSCHPILYYTNIESALHADASWNANALS